MNLFTQFIGGCRTLLVQEPAVFWGGALTFAGMGLAWARFRRPDGGPVGRRPMTWFKEVEK